MNHTPSSPKNQRPIRSYVIRSGRMTASQDRGLEQYWKTYGLELSDQKLDLEKCFQGSAPVILEIGFGMGQSLLAQGLAYPDYHFIGIEVHPPGVGALLSQLHQHQLHNVRLFRADAIEVLQNCIADRSLFKVQIFFPDPWPKKRHHKRRLIQAAFVQLIARKLKAEGILHIATDWENYAEHIIDVMNGIPQFERVTASDIKRPETKFEVRGKKRGHAIWDLIYQNQK